jgi:hypothetical protein
MSVTKRKFTKIGQVWANKEDPDKFYIRLGEKGRNEKYNTTVELVIKDASGNVIGTQTDGFLTLSDPRNSKFADSASLDKVPNLKFDVLLGQDQ